MRDPDPACHRVYLLSLWRETADAPWRAALRQSDTQERIGFADLEALALFLLRLDGSQAQPSDPSATTGDNTPPALGIEPNDQT
jgi:hypothetical protein